MKRSTFGHTTQVFAFLVMFVLASYDGESAAPAQSTGTAEETVALDTPIVISGRVLDAATNEPITKFELG